MGSVVRERERQVHRLEFLRAEGREFRRRGAKHLYGAELQRLDLFLVLVERRVRIDFDFGLAVGVLLGELLESQRALALRRVVRDDVAVLDDDWGLRPAGLAVSHGECGGADADTEFATGKFHIFMLLSGRDTAKPRRRGVSPKSPAHQPAQRSLRPY